MEMQIQPPKPLPLHVVGWLSLPWRHWGYISGTLFFGLLFLTFAPFPFLVRLLGLVVPFLIALALSIPYAGLHMDEWLALAWKYACRPGVRMSQRQQQDEAPDEALLGGDLDGDQPPAAEASGLQPPFEPPPEAMEPEMPPSAWPGPLAPSIGWPGAEVWGADTPHAEELAGVIGQPFFIGASGVFRRGSGEWGEAPLEAASTPDLSPGDTGSAAPGAAGMLWRPPAAPPEDEHLPPEVVPFPTMRKSRDFFTADSFLLDQPARKLRGSPPRKKRWA